MVLFCMDYYINKPFWALESIEQFCLKLMLDALAYSLAQKLSKSDDEQSELLIMFRVASRMINGLMHPSFFTSSLLRW